MIRSSLQTVALSRDTKLFAYVSFTVCCVEILRPFLSFLKSRRSLDKYFIRFNSLPFSVALKLSILLIVYQFFLFRLRTMALVDIMIPILTSLGYA